MVSPLRVALRRERREVLRALVDLLCPGGCPSCGADTASRGFCRPCRAQLQRRPQPWCRRCGAPVFGPCRADHRGIQGLLVVRAPFRYAGTGGGLVRRFKFDRDRAARRVLVRAMAAALESWVASEGRRAVFVSVPLHPRKRRARGSDHAAVLAAGVARRLGRPFVPNALRRLRETLPQGDVRVVSRRENVRGAFAAARPRRLDGRLVVLVDDVRTSGSTALECARVLRAAGARGVALLTAAQA